MTDRPIVLIEYGINALAVALVAEHWAITSGHECETFQRADLPQGVALLHVGIARPVALTLLPGELDSATFKALEDTYGIVGHVTVGTAIGRNTLVRYINGVPQEVTL